MNRDPSPRRWLSCLGFALLATVSAAQADVGARVLLQEWSPLTPKQQPLRVLTNDPKIVSEQIQKGWTYARPVVCAGVIAAMVDAVKSKGQQLRDVKCLLDQAPAFSLAGGGVNVLSARLAVGGYVEATTTVPGPTGSGLDPRFSLALTTQVALVMSVQPAPDQTLRIDKLVFTVSNANIDSHNASADVIKFVVEDLLNAFKGVNFKTFAENAINRQSLDLTQRFNAELAPVNALLRGPSAAVRVAVWGRPDAVIVAFGPRALIPPTGGNMFGALRWDAGRAIAPGGCDSFSIAAKVQVGPAPLRDPGGYFEPGDAPMLSVGTFQAARPLAANECRYRMSGLAAGWPNEVHARSSIGTGKSAGNSLMRVNYTVSGDGWDGHTVVPQPSAERNFLVHGTVSGEATLDAGAAAKQRLRSPADPVINPAALGAANVLKARSTPGVAFAEPAKGVRAAAVLGAAGAKPVLGTTATAQQKADSVSLNPQPLPPSALTPIQQAPSALR